MFCRYYVEAAITIVTKVTIIKNLYLIGTFCIWNCRYLLEAMLRIIV